MKSFTLTVLLVCVIATWSPVAVNAGRFDRSDAGRRDEEMRARIVERMATRKEKLGEMIEERKNQLADHESGRSLLSGDDHERVKRQIKNFSRKFEQLSNISPSEHEEMVMREMEMLQMHDREHRRLQRDELYDSRFRNENL
mmetsp:Transcript_1544/g.1970  ORF Transcript_1544/g.1970 Transcript_1544/m.1970 type:complete len:142 (+) Transcript_1544:117-542(+)|eukprot:CAMPEP_0172498130 /NCGR_PEP_ID=MMETSP1066-20121228/109676_1 /TAXON_ID=671091 /ORGANISM="Coscinodiscus wailesii, Strain CCMP2513" /LENGTH=141 /DNA_ID=CAMNT_0013271279 /DNA_START=102 /DNA_END=527 /DNA_ORIENTATION=+